MTGLVPVFDLDGTLLDSDAALVDAFVALGVPAASVTFGHVVRDECERLGLSLVTYLEVYDTAAAQPFPGAEALIDVLGRWALCSNKHGVSGRAELARLGWAPDLALFADSFDGHPKQLGPVLHRLGLRGPQVVFVGDTAHDRACARAVGATFALAGWNPRAVAGDGDVVLSQPADLLPLLTSRR